MRRIKQLSAHLVNQIAAGEVIERPASAVKELVENAIDAGAVQIVVELEEGGKRLLRVTDDGFGIDPVDLPLAVQSHATSKLRTEEDLHSVHTLGFRGEALASMASVGELDLVSRTAEQDAGERVVSRDGVVERGAPEMIQPGTRVTLRNLFYNVPARKHFLRTDRAELNRVSAAVQHVAMAVPEVGFTLVHDGKVLFRYPKGQSLRDRVCEILGEETMSRMLELDPNHPQLRGWVGRPDLSRRTTQSVYTFLNGRFIRDRTLLHAVREGFRGFQIPGRNPVAVLFLQVPPEEFDINVHPAKQEVRFRESGDVFSLLRGSIRRRLEKEGSVPDLLPPSAAGSSSGGAAPSRTPYSSFGARGSDFSSLSSSAPPERVAEPGSRDWPSAAAPAHDDAATPHGDVRPGTPAPSHRALPSEPELVDGREVRVFQVRNAYLVIEEETGLTVIDQHALHEKILYEEILEAREQGNLRQPLLIPETVSLSPEAWVKFGDLKETLAELGLELEEFGDRTVLVRAVPAGFENRNISSFLLELMERLSKAPASSKSKSSTRPTIELREHIVETMACKRAVKAGQKLTPQEQLDLVRGRARAFQPQNCPHGRPSELFISWEELDRRFDRK